MSIIINTIESILGIRTNYSFPERIAKGKELLGRANSSIKILSGTLNSEFYGNEEILKALRESKAKVEIIHGPNVEENIISGLENLSPNGRIKLYKLDTEPLGHFMVIDEKHVRVESDHLATEKEKKAFIKYNSLFLAQRLDEEFMALKANHEAGSSIKLK